VLLGERAAEDDSGEGEWVQRLSTQQLMLKGGSVDAFCGGSDAAAEQLYDELMARTWALHAVLQSVMTDVRRRDVATQLAAAADRHVRDLRDEADAGCTVRAVLWPTGCLPSPSDAWWATPLGLLMRERRPKLVQPDDHRMRRERAELVAS
jgi:hypothetical protein